MGRKDNGLRLARFRLHSQFLPRWCGRLRFRAGCGKLPGAVSRALGAGVGDETASLATQWIDRLAVAVLVISNGKVGGYHGRKDG